MAALPCRIGSLEPQGTGSPARRCGGSGTAGTPPARAVLAQVIERFGLLVRELGLKVGLSSNRWILSSKLLGIVVAVLGMIMLIAALFHFVQVRRTIEEERYQPGLFFPILLTGIAALIGFLLAIYLTITT